MCEKNEKKQKYICNVCNENEVENEIDVCDRCAEGIAKEFQNDEEFWAELEEELRCR